MIDQAALFLNGPVKEGLNDKSQQQLLTCLLAEELTAAYQAGLIIGKANNERDF